LFKKFSGIDVFDIEINEKDPDKLVEIIASLEPTFGGINLEDIKAPDCFYVERKLRERMKIPVFHDDQHGTAIVVGAAILNGLKIVGKDPKKIKLVTSGAGAAALACLGLLVKLGIPRENIWVTDLAGVVYEGRTELMDEDKIQFVQKTEHRTLAQVTQLRPDRVALYAYAHLPERFKPQRRIQAAELPAPAAKITMLSHSLDAFDAAGYVYVGMDHFALPGDALAVARRQGRLHRNFQGYSTQPDCDLIALGVSAIGRIGATYSQNAKTLEDYYDRLDQGRLPVVRGLALSRDDLIRRSVIMALMCQGELQFESLELAFLMDFKAYFAGELQALSVLQAQGLVQVGQSAITVTAQGWFFVRAVAMVFDRYLQADRNRTRFSKII
jgi:hypothetical protein